MSFTNDVLHEFSSEVLPTDNYQEIIEKLKTNLFSTTGIGIAAPQIGILKRIIICKINGNFVVMINPSWINKGTDKKQSKEGCLSFPFTFVKKQRFYRIVVKYFDENFVEQTLNLSGLSSFIVQHEVDHLNGITIV